tara:strand:+ start:2946 stop:3077 length:132 start_codon:yes stop_codon:yes gene_type:complete
LIGDARRDNQAGVFNNAPPTSLDYEESASGVDSDIPASYFEFE